MVWINQVRSKVQIGLQIDMTFISSTNGTQFVCLGIRDIGSWVSCKYFPRQKSGCDQPSYKTASGQLRLRIRWIYRHAAQPSTAKHSQAQPSTAKHSQAQPSTTKLQDKEVSWAPFGESQSLAAKPITAGLLLMYITYIVYSIHMSCLGEPVQGREMLLRCVNQLGQDNACTE